MSFLLCCCCCRDTSTARVAPSSPTELNESSIGARSHTESRTSAIASDRLAQTYQLGEESYSLPSSFVSESEESVYPPPPVPALRMQRSHGMTHLPGFTVDTPSTLTRSRGSRTFKPVQENKELHPSTSVRSQPSQPLSLDSFDFTSSQELGTGSFATAFKVQVKEHPRHWMVLKRFNKSHIDSAPEGYGRDAIEREVATNQRIRHPWIPHISGLLEDDNHLYMVMDLVPGQDLDLALNKREGRLFPAELVQSIALQLAKLIIFLHEHQIAHFDIKPENIILREGRISLIDFGFARNLEKQSRFERLAGTLDYIAPEVIGRNYDKEADWWSYGVLLYELLTGRLPFEASEEQIRNLAQVKGIDLNALSEEERKNQEEKLELELVYFKIQDTTPDFSLIEDPGAKDLVQRLLEKDPAERFGCSGEAQIARHPFFTSKASDERAGRAA